MQFTKYNSIENSYKEKIINQIYTQGFNNINWVVTDKDFGKILRLYSQDLYEEAEVVKVDKQVSKILNKEICNIIRPLFLKYEI